jgi:hypothetical protein
MTPSGKPLTAPTPKQVAQKLHTKLEKPQAPQFVSKTHSSQDELFALSEMTMKVVEILQMEPHKKMGLVGRAKGKVSSADSKSIRKTKTSKSGATAVSAKQQRPQSAPVRMSYIMDPIPEQPLPKPRIRIEKCPENDKYYRPLSHNKPWSLESDAFLVRNYEHKHKDFSEILSVAKMEYEGCEKFKKLPLEIRKLHHHVKPKEKPTERRPKSVIIKDSVDEHRQAWEMHSDEPETSRPPSPSGSDGEEAVPVCHGHVRFSVSPSQQISFQLQQQQQQQQQHQSVRVNTDTAAPSKLSSLNSKRLSTATQKANVRPNTAPAKINVSTLTPNPTKVTNPPTSFTSSTKMTVDDAIRQALKASVEERRQLREAKAFEPKRGSLLGDHTEIWIKAIESSVWATSTRGSAL